MFSHFELVFSLYQLLRETAGSLAPKRSTYIKLRLLLGAEQVVNSGFLEHWFWNQSPAGAETHCESCENELKQ